MRSFGIDLSAGLFLAAAFTLFSAPSGCPQATGAFLIETTQRETARMRSGHLKRRQKVNTQRVIKQLKTPVITGVQKLLRGVQAEHAVFDYLQLVSEHGEFQVKHRDIAAYCNVGLGSVGAILKRLAQRGAIEYQCSKAYGTKGKVLDRVNA